MDKLKELEFLVKALEERNESVINQADGVTKELAPFCRQWNDTQAIISTAMATRVILRCMRDVIAEAKGEQ